MTCEVTRACDADRERYLSHLNGKLVGEGYVTPDEADEMQDLIFAANKLTNLEAILTNRGLPVPPRPVLPQVQSLRRRDYGIPENFLPAGIALIMTGLLVGILPAVGLSAVHNGLADMLVAFCQVCGFGTAMWTAVLMIVGVCFWEEEYDKAKRRARDRTRR